MRDNPFDPTPPSLAAIEAFLARECTPDDERAVRHWAGPAWRPDLAEAVRAIVREERGTTTDPHEVIEALRLRLGLPGATVPLSRMSAAAASVPPDARRRGIGQTPTVAWSPRVRWSAALVAGVVVLAVLPRVWRSIGPRVTPIPARAYVTGRAQHTMVDFPDGTRVMLAPETRLTYAVDASGMRIADVQGDVQFSVARDARRPFVVRTSGTTTRVLGTQFEVRQYPTDRVVQVTVTSGKVAVSTRTHDMHVTLTAGMVGLATDSTVRRLMIDSLRPYTSWTPTELVFRSVPAPEVFATLTRWYGYRFQLADSTLASESLTMVLDAQSSSNALRTIKLLLNVDLTFDGDLVTLHARRRDQLHDADRSILRTKLFTPHHEVGR